MDSTATAKKTGNEKPQAPREQVRGCRARIVYVSGLDDTCTFEQIEEAVDRALAVSPNSPARPVSHIKRLSDETAFVVLDSAETANALIRKPRHQFVIDGWHLAARQVYEFEECPADRIPTRLVVFGWFTSEDEQEGLRDFSASYSDAVNLFGPVKSMTSRFITLKDGGKNQLIFLDYASADVAAATRQIIRGATEMATLNADYAKVDVPRIAPSTSSSSSSKTTKAAKATKICERNSCREAPVFATNAKNAPRWCLKHKPPGSYIVRVA